MSATWPSSLPERPDRGGFNEQPQDNRVRSNMDTGPAKQRRRFTAAVVQYTVQITLTTTELAGFRTFYHSTLGGGILPFDWTNPIDGSAATFRFVGPYSTAPAGDTLDVVVSFDLEELP